MLPLFYTDYFWYLAIYIIAIYNRNGYMMFRLNYCIFILAYTE